MIPRCPHCRARVLQKAQDGKIKLRTNIVVFDGHDGATVKCRKCRADIPLQLHLGADLRKALSAPERKLMVRKTLD